MNQSDVVLLDRAQVATELIEAGVVVRLSVDELVTISADLGLPVVLDGGLSVQVDSVDRPAAKRSLASKGLLTEDERGIHLVPWLELLADAAADPLCLATARREGDDGAWEWAFFAAEDIGVQQQVDDAGVIAWAPFAPERLIDLLVDALGLENADRAGTHTFRSTFGELALYQAGGQALDLQADSAPAFSAYTSARSAGPVGLQLLQVLDRLSPDPQPRELMWEALADGSYWELELGERADDPDLTPVVVSCRSGRELFERLISLFPIDVPVVLSESTEGV